MLKHLIETVARGRFALPLVVSLALVGIAITEFTYRHARNTLDGGIALTEARIHSAALLQAMTDHEMATRLFLITGQPDEAERMRGAAKAMRKIQQQAFDHVTRLDSAGLISMDKVRALIDERVATFDRWLQIAADGRRDEALSTSVTNSSRASRDELRSEYDAVLRRAADVQQVARVSLYRALMLNRTAIHLLMALSVAALWLFMRKLHESDRDKAQEQQRLAVLVAQRSEQLQELAGHLVSVREGERARLARELHDELGGLLTAVKLELARLRRVAGIPAEASSRVVSIEERLNEGIALKRRIIENLRPSALDQLGLVAALEILCKDVSTTLGVPVHTEFEVVRVDKNTELTIYRLVQEALTNISKYAHCTCASVRLRANADHVEVVVADDGCGFDSNGLKHGHGLLGMRVRVEAHAGTWSINSKPGDGTVVKAELPIEQEEQASPGAATT